MEDSEIDSCGFGLLVDVRNRKSSKLIQAALLGLARLSHRGAIGEDGLSGDGCGIMIQLDQPFYSNLADEVGIVLKSPFAVGMCFLNKKNANQNRLTLEETLKNLGFTTAGWRDVPVNLKYAPQDPNQKIPLFAQIFVEYPLYWSVDVVEKKLYMAKLLSQFVLQEEPDFSICSLSSKTIVYKALVLTQNLPLFYPDLQDKRLTSAVALFHQRFSTNTLSSWPLAHPFSTLAHNGEINTIQGNRHYAQQFTYSLIKQHFPELKELPSLITTKGSDSHSMDNLLEALINAGMSCPEALRLMIPPAWENDSQMCAQEKAFYGYHALHLPPWEGPAAIAFFDGRYAGCLLDRNGFRPARIVKTKNNWIGIGSEVGIFDFPSKDIIEMSRIKPGELLVIDLQQEEVIDSERFIKSCISTHPYEAWMKKKAQTIGIAESIDIIDQYIPITDSTYKFFDVSFEEKEQVMRYMSEYAVEPTFSMGDDTPLAALSYKPRQLFDFFRQQFAQVTNPPVDSLREQYVISAKTYLGNRSTITKRDEHLAEQIEIPSPLLTFSQLNALTSISSVQYAINNVSLAYANEVTLQQALEELTQKITSSLNKKHQIIIFSDEALASSELSIHPALAIGAVHHALIKLHQRERVSLIVKSGWVRDAHHLAILTACGAEAVFPWLAYNIVIELALQNENDPLEALALYHKALDKGLLKICSKMGVCTINSYRGSQLFHVMGFNAEIMQQCFSQSAYWLEQFDWNTLDSHQKEFYKASINPNLNPRQGGLYKFQYQGEYHDYNPNVVTSLLRAVSEKDSRYYQQFKELINYRQPVMVRDFLNITRCASPIKMEQVEPISSIFKRFDTAAMSLGALAPEAHESLAVAMNTLGGRSNSGEGGEASYRHGQINRSKIKQVASGRFGVTAEYLMSAEVIQIKIAQGAKPGEGGQLPGNKVNPLIAELRFCSPGVTLISPPPHHDIYSIEDLSQLIFDLKQINPKAFVSVKLVSAPGIGTIAAGVVKAYADMITISGYDGGTGASPLSSIRYTGCPWELGLRETQRVLLNNKLRHRVTLQIDGGLKTGLDVVKAALFGAESFGFGTAPMIALGCKYLRICHLNNCATGIATQDERLRSAYYQGTPERVMNYMQWVAEEVRELLALMGFTSVQEIIGRVDLLRLLDQCTQSNDMGLNKLLSQPIVSPEYQKKLYLKNRNQPFDKGILANKILQDLMPSLLQHQSFSGNYAIANYNRSIGANIAGEIATLYGNQGYKATLQLNFEGIAGQSFGAWMVQGMSLYLEGAANDYVAKGMSGGELIIVPFRASQINPRKSCIAGNTCLYGATGGLCFIDGLAGQRFAVRNSGALAIALGVGDHGCEYMTSGTAVILSTPGTNFAAGMTGGIAFVYDDEGCMQAKCNQESITLHNMSHPDLISYQEQLSQLIKAFHIKTGSAVALEIITNLEMLWPKFYLILPNNISPYSNKNAEVPL